MGSVPKIIDLAEKCCGCGACAASCRTGCLAMEPDAEGFLRPRLNGARCVRCGRCDFVCPALHPKDAVMPVETVWAKSRSGEILDASSSGGLFGMLGRAVVDSGGLVVGAAFVDGCKRVEHTIAEDYEALLVLQRSKYVQSSVGSDVYSQVGKALRDGRKVLFVGTACQVAGMRNYLGRLADSDLFFSVDVICHGAPSPLLWERWVKHVASLEGAEIDEVNFRSKTTGWSSYSVLYYVRTEKDASRVRGGRYGDDWYMRAFLDNVSLRPSCFGCAAKRSCGSDVTLGDFWGFADLHSEIDSTKGVSAVLCNTEKGAAALHAVLDGADHGVATYGEVLAGNPALEASVEPHPQRSAFMAALVDGSTIESMMRRWSFEDTFWSRAKRKLKRVLKG